MRKVAGLLAAAMLVASWGLAFARFDLADVRGKLSAEAAARVAEQRRQRQSAAQHDGATGRADGTAVQK